MFQVRDFSHQNRNVNMFMTTGATEWEEPHCVRFLKSWTGLRSNWLLVPLCPCWFFLILRSPSLTIPTVRHFWKRQNWHRFRLFLSTGQSLLARQTYLEFFWTVRCKKKKYEEWGWTLLETWYKYVYRLVTSYYLEKSFAALTGANPIVLTGGMVSTHRTAALTSTL